MTVATRTGFELEAAIESYRRTRRTELAEQTLDRIYVPRLTVFAGWLRGLGMPTDVGAIRREHVEAYIDWLQHDAANNRSGETGHKSATVSIAFRTLRTFFNWLVYEDEIKRSPMERMKAPRVVEEAPKVLTDVQLERLYKACAGRTFDDRRDAALLRLLADTGMRRGKLAGLTVSDLHLDGAGLILLRGETSKGKRDRVVPLSREAVAALDKYLRVRHSHFHAALPWLWLGKRGRLSDSGILQVVERRGRQAGVVGLHPHRFRHTFAHRGQREGMSATSLMAIGGWKDAAMLARYGRSAAAELAVAEYRRVFDAVR
ncbi:MAG TPA: tyrosine-type recombinase/integrase [Candidatus Limnocylindria bacterium]